MVTVPEVTTGGKDNLRKPGLFCKKGGQASVMDIILPFEDNPKGFTEVTAEKVPMPCVLLLSD